MGAPVTRILKSERASDREAVAKIAREALKAMGPRPGDDDPKRQAEWDGYALAAAGEYDPEDMGYDVERLNAEYALVLVGSQALVIHQCEQAEPGERIRFLKPEAFKAFFSNRFTEVRTADGKIRTMSWANRWLDDRNRRTYSGIEFYPDPENKPGRADHLNLWQGFSVTPKQGGTYHIFRDHLLENVCRGDRGHFEWLFGWFAQMMQAPREKPGTAIVLRGAMGCGKSTVGEVFGSLIEAHHFQVDDPRFVTGNFNSHMARCLLLQADEATWAGDKAAEGRLKGLITASSQMIEAKGVDAIKMPNYVRLLKTTNNDWSVPAGKDERRFAVFDVDDRCAKNHGYFQEMREELDNGGREALLYDLLHFDLRRINLREIPKTGALLEEKARSLDPIEDWLLDRLVEGRPTRNHDCWPSFVQVNALYDDYIRASERTGIKRRSGQTVFGTKLRKLLPGIVKKRVTMPTEDDPGNRENVYVLPTLEQCRQAFDRLFEQDIPWGEGDA